ncbi:nuclear transport factor 2 family protein [Indibacter alkaliphilus]|nr:hypothetical protein [Indibacter alkaliphilus]
MKNHIVTVILLFFSFYGYAQGDFRKQTDEAIYQLISDYNTARENKNEELLRSILLIDIDQLVSSGEWRRGLESAVEGMKNSSENNPGERKLEVDQIRYLNQQNAIVDAKYTISSGDGSQRNMWSTFIVVMTPERWMIAAIRNMLPAQN